MAVAWRMLLLALLMQKCIGQELNQEEIQQALHRVQNFVKAQKSHLAKARRLNSAPVMPDFSKMCASTCWTSITGGMVAMIKKLESDPVCAAQMSSDPECTSTSTATVTVTTTTTPAPARRLSEPTQAVEHSCMFDQCGPTDHIGMMCAAIADPESPYHSMVAGDSCTTASLEWYCGAICGTACQADSVETRKIFCQPMDDSQDTSSSAPAEEAPPPEQCEEGGGGMDGDAMSEAFDMMCMKNPAGQYCQALAMEWMTKGAFQAMPSDLFPDVCKVDCSTPTGQAIKAMGCCMANSLHGMGSADEQAARTAIYACGGMEAMTFCGGSDSMAIPQVMLVGGKGLETCPTNAIESLAVQSVIAKEIGVKKKNVNLLVCKATGSTCGGGRRLPEATNTMEYTVVVKGSKETIAAKQAAIAVKMKTVETSSGGKTNVPAKGVQPQTSKAGQNPLGLLLGMLVVSALFK